VHSLDDLVRRTEGLQPGRRLFHAVSGVTLAVSVGLQVGGRSVGPWIVGAGLAVALILDVVRLYNPEANRLFFRLLRPLASPRERDRLASSTWYLAGVGAVMLSFDTDVAAIGILVLALADPAAGYVGRRWGRMRLGLGTVAGSMTFFVVSVAVFAAFYSLPLALAMALVVTTLEAVPIPLDDNFTIPLVAGAVQWLSHGFA